MSTYFHMTKTAALAAFAALFGSAAGIADESDNRLSGRASVYGNLHQESLENVSSRDAILFAARSGASPTEMWRVLEHGEKVECLDCIPYVGELLYDGHPKTREIAAWWLRRRVFGVFGPGEVYSRVVDTLQNDESDARRAYAAEALGEFLMRAGVRHVASSVINDSSPRVRVAAVNALRRLNTQGPGLELARAVGDPAAEVRLAALEAAVRINVFTEVDAVVERISDDDPLVRRAAVQALGKMRVVDAVLGLMALVDPELEPDARVRLAAVAALGQIGDPAARTTVEQARADTDFLVRSAAEVALRQL